MTDNRKPLVLITGAAGDIGSSLADTLRENYTVVGLDRESASSDDAFIELDLSSETSVADAMKTLRGEHGDHIASVVHLAAYFDFSGDENPLYREINVEGTARLLRALQGFSVEQFLYSSTMLVHRAGKVGERIDERTPIEPAWVYPQSKADAEQVIRTEAGAIPYAILRLAGLYDEHVCVPTLANQIARIYERNFQSRVHPGPMNAGQAFLHRDDMMRAFTQAIDGRASLPRDTAVLVGEPDVMSFDELQDALGRLIHGESEWRTMTVPPALAKAGAWLQEKAEPIVPDAIDGGEPPFVRPFMVDLAQDHYDLDISLAGRLLGWSPQHRLRQTLPALVANLKEDPATWYEANKVTPPPSLRRGASRKE